MVTIITTCPSCSTYKDLDTQKIKCQERMFYQSALGHYNCGACGVKLAEDVAETLLRQALNHLKFGNN